MDSDKLHNGHSPNGESAAHAQPQPTQPVQDKEEQPRPSQGGRGGVLRPLLSRRARPVSPMPGEVEPYKGTRMHLLVSGIVLTILLTAIMAVPILPGQVDVKPGIPADTDIFSPTSLRFDSETLTEKARKDAMEDPSNEVWVQDTNVVQRQRSYLLRHLSIVDNVRANDSPDPQTAHTQLASLSSMQGITLTDGQISTLLIIADSEYDFWRDNAVLATFDALMREGRLSSERDMQAARSALPDRLPSTLNANARGAAIQFIAPLLAVNIRLDEEQTAQRREVAATNVKPVSVTVQKGEAILRQGELATPEALEKMREAGLLSRELSLAGVGGTVGVVGLLMLLLHLYIWRQAPVVWQRQKQLILVGLLLVATVLVARLFLPGHDWLPYLLPVAAVSMLLAVLVSVNLAVLVTFVLSVLLGLVVTNGLSMELPIYYIAGGLTGIFTLTKIERVSAFAVAGASIAGASFLSAVALRTLGGSALDWTELGLLMLASAFNGGIATSVTYAAFSLLGTIFGITTPLQLMELAHPDQPLLRRLMQEAPGTYHHSLVVSNLAERAAEMVGADVLLTRVCAYYHDIGKVERPYYFIDNQSGMRNVHDDLTPDASAAIIAEHVRDGVRMAQKYKLPKRVMDAIPQHHGTMLIKYFYHKALQANPLANPDDYRYPGPKPQTKENAILMLADGVEATVRAMAQNGALDKFTTGSLRNSDATEGNDQYKDQAALPEDAIGQVVHKVISERIEEGQLDECDLTVRDIARIQEAFVSMLKGIYHPRVAYPPAPVANTEYRMPSAELSPGGGQPAAEKSMELASDKGR